MNLNLRSTFLALLLSSLVVGCGGGESWPDVVLDPSYYTNKYEYAQDTSFLGRGINLGNYFEAEVQPTCPTGENCWTGRFLEQADIDLIKAAGFKSVRIPVRWTDHAEDIPPYEIDDAFLDRVQVVVDWAIAADLKVVINTHHYVEMMNQPAENLPGHRARLAAIWGQICDRFPTTSYPVDQVVFELLNEPNGTVGYTEWNGIIAELTTVIREDKGQTDRIIMVGTANWGGPTGLAQLDLPDSADATNTIITIHWYEPFHFTHQGAEWVGGSSAWIGTTWLGTSVEQADLIDLYEGVEAWKDDVGIDFEIFVGEFGVYAKHARPEYRKAWTAFVAREAEARGMSWAYWEFDQGFGAYNRDAGEWRPEIFDALLPPDAPPPPPE
jgi:endoglucanase